MNYVRFAIRALFITCIVILTSSVLLAQDNPAFPSEYQYLSNWKKLAPEMQQVWNDAKKNSAMMDQRIDCFLAFREPGDQGDEGFLLHAGFSTDVMAGMSARGHMLIKSLPAVAALPAVRRIGLAKPVGSSN